MDMTQSFPGPRHSEVIADPAEGCATIYDANMYDVEPEELRAMAKMFTQAAQHLEAGRARHRP